MRIYKVVTDIINNNNKYFQVVSNLLEPISQLHHQFHQQSKELWISLLVNQVQTLQEVVLEKGNKKIR